MRQCLSLLFLVLLLAPARSLAQEAPAIPEGLQKTYRAFATAMVEGDAQRAVEFYAEDAVVLVTHEHVYRGRRAIRRGFLADYLDDGAGAGEDGSGTEIGVDRVVVGEAVVTLAGRYTNPTGAAGVYSNTWERQADGSWKLAASVLTFESPDRSPSGGSFSCTQVLGFSQSMQWYAGRSVADHVDENSRPDLSALAPGAFLPGWQGRFFMGAAIDRWTDPDFPGWSGAHRLAHETPAHCGRDEVDRVVFNVSGEARSPRAWAVAVDSVADAIRAKLPAVREIVMQPVVGAPKGECTDVRAARNHPVIAEGIRRAAERGGVTAGPDPKVAGCDQFSDALGHLTVEGAEHVRRALRKHYGPSTAVPAPTAAAQDTTLIVENGRVIVGDGTVLERGNVIVAGDRIVSITEGTVEAPDARRIDAAGRTVLPGLIDAHVHLTIGPGVHDSASLAAFLAERVPGVLQRFLRHGVTTVRSTGDYWPWIGRVRDRVAAGEIQGPRVLTAGPVLTAEGAHPAVTVCPPESAFCRTGLARELGSPREARDAVGRLAAEGVDFVKLVSDSLLAPVQISDELVAAIVDQAHREGLEAVGHVAEAGFMERAAEAGLDGFVHPTMNAIDEERTRELASVLADHRTPVTTTLSAALVYGGGPVTELLEAVSEGREGVESQAREVAHLAEEGVRIVVGTDWCPCGPAVAEGPEPAVRAGAVTVTEMEMLTWGGLSEEAILAAATREAARALGLSSDLGTLEPGKLADLIVVDGDPLEDLSALRDVEVVVQGGEMVAGRMERNGSEMLPVHRQDWSQAQQEVWEREVAYWEAVEAADVERFMALWNEGFVGWPASEEEPVSRSDLRGFVEAWFDEVRSTEFRWDRTPRAVTVFDDIAVTFYRARSVYGDTDGEESSEVGRSSHVWQKQRGEWTVFAGMSAPGEDDDPSPQR